MSRYLKPGTLVRRTDLSGNSSEDGVVIHCWLDDALGFFDCYVAFCGMAITAAAWAMHWATTATTAAAEAVRRAEAAEAVRRAEEEAEAQARQAAEEALRPSVFFDITGRNQARLNRERWL